MTRSIPRQCDPDTIPLQREILYGPVRSRRLGMSLGLNILPREIKACSLDCSYCQYSWTGMKTLDPRILRPFLPTRDEVSAAVKRRLTELAAHGTPPDTLTFSGNGEATLHPDFSAIVSDVVALRDQIAPACRTAILSNSTNVGSAEIREALLMLDDPILKLDAGRAETFKALNRPAPGVSWESIVAGLRAMGPAIVIQAMFVCGRTDNSTDEEVDLWARQIRRIGPRFVQIYTLDRGPADRELLPVPSERLRQIASRLRSLADAEAVVFE